MRKNQLFKRIIVAYNFVRHGKGNVRIMTCQKCGSMLIKPISKTPNEGAYLKNGRHIDAWWAEFSQCQKCGAVCEEVQLWNFDGNPQKINPHVIIEQKSKKEDRI